MNAPMTDAALREELRELAKKAWLRGHAVGTRDATQRRRWAALAGFALGVLVGTWL